ncbi:MAG: hypothetical protein J7L62_07530 [Candidatus Aminicenantes bacterium]|nr:hypothetical protein [Candidatus Aminicenantes bacterium]
MRIEVLEHIAQLEKEPKNFMLDPFQEQVFFNLYLEIPVRRTLYIISPSLSILYPEKNSDVEREIARKEEQLSKVRRLILESLINNTAILEANSYFIEQNDFFLLCRFSESWGDNGYRLKFYTHDVKDIIVNYDDKLYVGHDFFYINGERKYFGLNDLIPYLDREFEYIKDKAGEFNLTNPLVKDYLVEIGELVGESLIAWEDNKLEINIEKDPIEKLNEATMRYMEIKHILVELHDEVREFEYKLRKKGEEESHLSRYVTKFRKDVVNILHYINMKVLSKIQERINSHTL